MDQQHDNTPPNVVWYLAVVKKFATSNVALAVIGKWICLVLGLFMIVMAFEQKDAPGKAALAAMACFFGIYARICQAEHQHQKNSPRDS